MPDEVAADDSGADLANPHDRDVATPDSSPNWNIRQALAWIIWGRLLPAKLPGLLDTAFDYDEGLPETKALDKDVTTALDVLNHAVMANRLPVCARQSSNPWPPPAPSPREHVPANVIDEVRRIRADGCIDIRNPNLDAVLHNRGPFFYDVCFRAGDVKRLRKAASNRPPKPPVPWADLLKWWQLEYLKEHSDPDKRPTTVQQHEAAKARFPDHVSPTFEQMKKLRAHPDTPSEWTESGRRPKSS